MKVPDAELRTGRPLPAAPEVTTAGYDTSRLVRKPLPVKLSEYDHSRLEREARKRATTKAQAVTEIVRWYLYEHPIPEDHPRWGDPDKRES